MQFSQTKIYLRTMDLIDLSQTILRDLPLGYGFLADQLRRAASSIPLNFAEGYGKRTSKKVSPELLSFSFRTLALGYRPLALYRLAFGAPLWRPSTSLPTARTPTRLSCGHSAVSTLNKVPK